MKILLSFRYDPHLVALKDHLQRAGDIVVDELSKADLVITDHTWPEGLRCVTQGFQFPSDLLLQSAPSNEIPMYFISKWFNGKDYAIQTILGIPLRGMMNENLGVDVWTGLYTKFIPSCHKGMFKDLKETLVAMSYVGFVTFNFNDDQCPIAIHGGIPYGGIFHAFEGICGKVSSFLTGDEPLLESIVVSLRVTRYPWPYESKGPRVAVGGLSEDVKRHFWYYGGTGPETEATDLGISTAWAQSLSEASRRALRTCRAIEVDGKQYRTDIASQSAITTQVLKSLGALGVGVDYEEKEGLSHPPLTGT